MVGGWKRVVGEPKCGGGGGGGGGAKRRLVGGNK